jgi:hypothetical protein
MIELRALSLFIGMLIGLIMIAIVCVSYIRNRRFDRSGLILVVLGAFLLAAPVWKDIQFRLPGSVSLVATRESGPEAVLNIFPSRVSSATFKVSVINESSAVTDEEVRKVLPALQKQIHEHFAPFWNVDADLTFVGSNEAPRPEDWWLVLLDNTDQPGSLGYYDIRDNVRVFGKAFVKDAKDYGIPWTEIVSQQLMNMLVNPRLNLTAFNPDGQTGGTLYMYTATDPCEADENSYEVDKVRVSDFIFPAWFQNVSTPIKHVTYDFRGKIGAPFQVLPGGYATILSVTVNGIGWSQKLYEAAKEHPSSDHVR